MEVLPAMAEMEVSAITVVMAMTAVMDTAAVM